MFPKRLTNRIKPRNAPNIKDLFTILVLPYGKYIKLLPFKSKIFLAKKNSQIFLWKT